MSSRPDIIYNEYGMDTGYMDRLRKLRPKAMWVKNYYGGSDLYSPTMNGDVRTVIQGCPTLWFREVAGYPNHVACMEFNELSAVVSRENWQIAVDRVYAADERLRVGDPDRKQCRLLGPLERPEQEGPWKLEVPKIIRPSIEELPDTEPGSREQSQVTHLETRRMQRGGAIVYGSDSATRFKTEQSIKKALTCHVI
ncbi:hypothetical protein D6D21_08568 [Aureobasidium pullulans]|uniref:Uncharacterized protein n=1 Tax=Aureobasidium pullulans TaxID=5580 RepID=A0A4S8YFW7_AURPU|nr:hypothetical protein D6D21_08568 [Aureobasidium pullulans]THW49480.1 hypothetical protein D6D22_01674 [Aureobasidium pullulans]